MIVNDLNRVSKEELNKIDKNYDIFEHKKQNYD